MDNKNKVLGLSCEKEKELIYLYRLMTSDQKITAYAFLASLQASEIEQLQLPANEEERTCT